MCKEKNRRWRPLLKKKIVLYNTQYFYFQMILSFRRHFPHLTITHLDGYYYSHSTDENIEAQKGI